MTDKEKLQNVKIIVSDLDGTLLANDGSISERSKKLIRELHKYDVLFSFSTGRLHSAVTDIAKELEINNPIIPNQIIAPLNIPIPIIIVLIIAKYIG